MNFDQEPMGVRITMPIVRRDVNSDISEDYTLPDYYPEIRKLLFARPTPLLPAKFVSGGKVDVSGVVDYTLVYISAEGKLCSAPLSAEYSFSLPLENIGDFELGEGLDSVAHTLCESTAVRVSAPRRIQLRSHLRTSISVWGKMLCSETLSGDAEGARIERLCERGACGEIFCESSELISLEDSFELSEDERIVLADGAVVIKERREGEDELSVDGEILVRMLVEQGESQSIKSILRRLPFEATVELDGVDLQRPQDARVSGYLTDLAISAEEGRVRISADAILEVCSTENRELEYAADAYCVARNSECDYKTLDLPLVLACSSDTMGICERIDAESVGYPDAALPLEAFATASVDSADLIDGKYLLRGTCRYSIISTRDGEYMASEISLPFVYECEASEPLEVSSLDAVVSVSSAKVGREDTKLCLECELGLEFTLFGESSIRMLDAIRLSEDCAERGGELIVCYPSSEDSLWSVAKRYAVAKDEILGDPASDGYVIIEA